MIRLGLTDLSGMGAKPLFGIHHGNGGCLGGDPEPTSSSLAGSILVAGLVVGTIASGGLLAGALVPFAEVSVSGAVAGTEISLGSIGFGLTQACSLEQGSDRGCVGE